MQYYFHTFIFFIFLHPPFLIHAEKAVVVVPVADLVGDPLCNSAHSYDTLPLCGGSYRFYDSCPRIHQLLFNEIVDVLEYRGNEARIAISNMYYCPPNSISRQTTYWTSTNNITPLTTLKKGGCSMDVFPPPLSPDNFSDNARVVTLVLPFFSPTMQRTYSAGTRFMCAGNESPHDYTVHIFDPVTKRCISEKIPKHLCFSPQHKTPAERIVTFVKILQMWATQDHGFIPYVWGGCSFTQRYQHESFTEHRDKTGSFCSYTQTNAAQPKSGFDCSNSIARAAQIAGIPYWFKNSTTIKQSLSQLAPHDKVESGDIIWIPGHVMVVGNTKKNTLIEASSYKYGNGRVQEVPLSAVFSGIKTYKDLVKIHLNNKTVQRINTRTHKKEDAHIPVKIFTMSSAWK